jgi:NAD(P)-dependent dehydrogenase (short-subunit alcohol dehydrogenase family)
MMRAVAGERRGRRRKVVNVSMIDGVYGVGGRVMTSTVAGAVFGFTRALGREWAPSGVNVNAIACGALSVEGHLWPFCKPSDDEEVERRVPVGRIGSQDDIAGCVVFLTSSSADFLSGHILELHGGLEIVDYE